MQKTLIRTRVTQKRYKNFFFFFINFSTFHPLLLKKKRPQGFSRLAILFFF